jgi:hypothetical protein
VNNNSFCVSIRKNDSGRFEIVNNRNYGQATSNPQDASRKRLSSSLQNDSGTCKNDAPRSRALDTIAPAEGFAIVPSDSHPTPNPHEAIAEVASSLANMTTRCEDLLRSAKTLGSVPIQQAARRELHVRRLQKKARGPWRERATVKGDDGASRGPPSVRRALRAHQGPDVEGRGAAAHADVRETQET